MQIDEIRFEEDLPALGLNWIKLGLEDVLYDPKTNTVYTPNTNQTAVMGKLQLGGAKETEEGPLQERANGGMIEDRGGRYIQGPDGKMQGSLPNPKLTGNAAAGDASGNLLDDDNLAAYMEPQKTKYAKSPQRSKKGIQIGAKQYNRLCSQMMANYQNLEAGERVCLRDGNKAFTVEADGSGGFTIKKITVKNGRR